MAILTKKKNASRTKPRNASKTKLKSKSKSKSKTRKNMKGGANDFGKLPVGEVPNKFSSEYTHRIHPRNYKQMINIFRQNGNQTINHARTSMGNAPPGFFQRGKNKLRNFFTRKRKYHINPLVQNSLVKNSPIDSVNVQNNFNKSLLPNQSGIKYNPLYRGLYGIDGPEGSTSTNNKYPRNSIKSLTNAVKDQEHSKYYNIILRQINYNTGNTGNIDKEQADKEFGNFLTLNNAAKHTKEQELLKQGAEFHKIDIISKFMDKLIVEKEKKKGAKVNTNETENIQNLATQMYNNLPANEKEYSLYEETRMF